MSWKFPKLSRSLGKPSKLFPAYYPPNFVGVHENEPISNYVEEFHNIPELTPSLPVIGTTYTLFQINDKKFVIELINYTTTTSYGTSELYFCVWKYLVKSADDTVIYDPNVTMNLLSNKPNSPYFADNKFGFSVMYNDETEQLAIMSIVELKVTYRQNPYVRTRSEIYPLPNANWVVISKELYNAFGNIEEYDSDPWSNAGYAGIGGGEGIFDFNSDVIGLPPIPSVDSVSSGFLQLFSGGLSKIVELSQYMWSTDFFDNIVKLTSNPIDIIMGLYMYPFVVPATSQKYVRAGNVITNIVMNVPDSQIFEIDCGVFPVPQFYGAYLDYEPFSKCEIYLPYCGTFNLSMDDISGKEINVRYRVDLLTGLCVAYVIIDGTVKYNFTGSCAVNIPISSRSFENLYNSIMGLVSGMFNDGKYTASSVGSISGVVMSGKNQITHGGIASGNAGYLGVQKPYLIFNVPRVAIPKGLNKYTGYPIFATYKLSDLEGYTEVEEIHLENMGTATKEEIDRIVSLLKGGVIL